MNPRLLADENTSHQFVTACHQLELGFPLVHISDWKQGAFLSVKDPALLMTLRDHAMILVGFDRASMSLHEATLTREGVGHAGIILFRRSVSTVAYSVQAQLLLDSWRTAKDWEWPDRLEYLPTLHLPALSA